MRNRLISVAAAAALAIAGCGSDTDDSTTSAPTAATTAASTSAAADSGLNVEAGQAFPAERCAMNEAVGTLTFLTGSSDATASSTIDVVTAAEAGYYADLCLDVEVLPGSTADNYSQVASGDAQFASGGSFSDVVRFGAENDADLVATTVEGRTAIDTLILRSGEAAGLPDLDGQTIAVIGELPPAIEVMLRGQGLESGENYDTVPLDGFDPIAEIETPEIAGFPGSKSDEVVELEQAGIGVRLFDPFDFGVPGSFGVIFTSASFVAEHPTAAQDFVRATARGLADAVADPTVAAESVVELSGDDSDTDGATSEAEILRWETEAQLILDGAHEGIGLGIPDPSALQSELDAYGEIGLFGNNIPEAADFLAGGLAAGIYDDATAVVWPG